MKMKKKITINSLKNAPSDKRFVPSINYKIRPVYSYMSIPNELASDNYNDYDEEIRKAG